LISAGRGKGHKADARKTNIREDALKRRTGKATQKDLFGEKLQSIFERSIDKADFFKNLESENIECYTRGQTVRCLDRANGKKHRLKTLGLVADFEAIQNKMASAESTKKTQAPKQEQQRKSKPSPNKSGLGTSDEWLAGDFTEREKQAQKNKWRSQDKKDKMVKERDEQTRFENVKETSSEWISGDFSNRDARARQEKSKENIKQYQEQQKDKDMESKEVRKRREEIRDQRATQAKEKTDESTHTRKPKR
jgi:hypothetical protein